MIATPLLLGTILLAQAEPTPLAISDLPGYRAALDAEPSGPIADVTFEQLWQHPADFQGRFVRVEGRVERRFRQPKFGTFPALVELWLLTGGSNPICLVCPESKAADLAEPGSTIRFSGTFLRMIRYPSTSGDRRAPLIVGKRAPERLKAPPAPGRDDSATGFSRLDWILGLVLAGIVMLVLLRRHLSRPLHLERPQPPPEFVSDEDGGELTDEH